MVVKYYNPYFAAMVRMHSDAVLSSTGAFLMKIMVHFRFGWIRLPDTCESALTCYSWLSKDAVASFLSADMF